jgi:predicted DNA-binding transcriptional regulator AlpA
VQRVIEAPAKDLLTAAECAAWLNVGETQFRKLWKEAGSFPRPVVLGEKKALRWYWLDVVCWAYLQVRMGESGPAPAEGNGTSAGRRPGRVIL